MKTFKQFLVEYEGVKWSGSVRKLVADGGDQIYVIPFSNSIIKRIFKPQSVTSFHITNWTNFQKLVKLQGSKKSVSSTTKLSELSRVARGVQAGGGMAVKIKGNLILSGRNDLMTIPDTSGARWVSIYSLGLKDWEWEIDNIREKIISGAAKKFDVELSGLVWPQILLRSNFGEKSGKIYHYMIKSYMDALEKLMLKNIDPLIDSFRDPLTGGETDTPYTAWNEILVNKFKIVEIFFTNESWLENFKKAGYDKKWPYHYFEGNSNTTLTSPDFEKFKKI